MQRDETVGSSPFDAEQATTPRAQSDPLIAGSSDRSGQQAPPTTPQTIGDYRIFGFLGRGGMGVVWEAEQQHPRRRVALKVMSARYVVDEVHIRMFHREAEVLGRLKHPGIAAVYESGRTDEGQYFFAMELVRGRTLAAWLESRSATVTPAELELRLRLFASVCEAVSYAHQRGIIHRDLKPANIIVLEPEAASHSSAVAIPAIKILDFGLARITDADAAVTSVLTEVGAIKGTLQYMAPEQARGDIEAIDVRTDVYALGMILYELVSGRRPYNVSGSALAEAVRVICEQSPRSLSASFSGTHRLDQDIDTIVTKALEKDADRRYDSVAALAGDIDRYLTSQPILARPPSASYQLRKLIQRHRAVFFATAAALMIFVAASVVSTGMYFRAEKARLEADQRAKELEEVSAFQSDMLAEIDISNAGQALMQEIHDRRAATPGSAGDFKAQLAAVNATDAVAAFLDRTIFKPAVQTIDTKYKDQPLVDAQLRLSVANSYIKLGRHQEALALTRQAYGLRKRVLGEDHPETIRAMGIMADQTFDTGGPAKAEPYYRQVLERRRRVLGADHRDTLISVTSYGNILGDLGRRDEAVVLLREALAAKRRVYGENHEETLVSINSLGYLLQNMGRLAEAEPLRREALEKSRRLLGEAHADTLIYIVNMASLLEDLERDSEAETLYREAVSKRRRVLGELHPRTLGAMHLLGSNLRKQGKLDEADLLLRQVLTRRRELLGDEHRGTLLTTVALAALEADRRRGPEALDLLRPIETAGRRAFGASSADLAFMLITMGRAKAQVGDMAAAQAILQEASQLIDRDPASLPALKRAAASALAELAAARGNATANLATR